jgi:NAD(P)-dependent dehydrogenase (short-subunit alcohol dehydrogenase family)
VTTAQRDVLVVTGSGGIGSAIAERLGAGRTVLIGDRDPAALEIAALRLSGVGHDVVTHVVDVTDAGDVAQFARVAADLGPVRQIAHTVGVSPQEAPVTDILAIDLLGAARVLEAFQPVVAPGGACVVIASMAGHVVSTSLTAGEERALATVPADELLDLPVAQAARFTDGPEAYGFAKRACALRVQAAALAWAERGARVNAISPGIVATPMGHRELDGPYGPIVRKLVDIAPAGRIGTPQDVAHVAAFLLDPASSFVTGIDLLADGGVVAALRIGG